WLRRSAAGAAGRTARGQGSARQRQSRAAIPQVRKPDQAPRTSCAVAPQAPLTAPGHRPATLPKLRAGEEKNRKTGERHFHNGGDRGGRDAQRTGTAERECRERRVTAPRRLCPATRNSIQVVSGGPAAVVLEQAAQALPADHLPAAQVRRP